MECESCVLMGLPINIDAMIAACMMTGNFILTCIWVCQFDKYALPNLLIISFPAV